MGVNINKEFMPSVANTVGTNLANYKIIKKDQFVYNNMQVARDRTIRIVRYADETPSIMSPAYKIFQVIDKNILNPEFLMLYFLRPEFDRLCWFYTDSSIRGSLDWAKFCNLKVPVPPIDIQEKIVNIYNFLNERIHLKNKINKNLTICIDVNFKNNLLNFNNYFTHELVSSEFGLIPKRWEVSTLTKIANYQNGLAMQKFPPENSEDCFKVLKIKELRQGFFDDASDLCSKNIKEECIVYDGDVIFSWSGSLLVDIWTGGTCGLNQHLFKVTSSEFDKWFYYCWTKFYLDQFILIAKDKATTMGHIKRKHLDDSLVLIPDKETYSKLTLLFKPLFDMLIKNKIEIKKLQNLRDVLMPKLMSGEVDVSRINSYLKIIIRKFISNPLNYLLRYLNENKNYIKNSKSNETLPKSGAIYKINKFFTKFTTRYRHHG